MLAKNYDGPVLCVDKASNGIFVPIGVLKSCTVSIRSSPIEILTLHSGPQWHSTLRRGSIQTVMGPLYYLDAIDHNVLEEYKALGVVMDWEIRFDGLGSVTGLCLIAALDLVASAPALACADVALEACGIIAWKDEPEAAFGDASDK